MHIILDNVSVRFPIYDAKQRSFKQSLIKAATGGNIKRGKVPEVEALRNISFALKEGHRVSLIGHNGSGKTTLLRVLAGVYAPIEGKIHIKGKVTSLLDSMLGMDQEATGIENIKLRSLFLGIHPKKINSLIDDIIEFSELGEFIHMPVQTYSSGMILRLAFSITTSISPEILLMDEWISVGDEKFKMKAEERLNKFINQAGILVMATHDKKLAERTCSTHIHLEHGEIIKSDLL